MSLIEGTPQDQFVPGPAGLDGVGTEVQAEGPPADDRRRRKVILLWVLAIGSVVLALIAGWYLLNRKPLTQLPGISVAEVPTYRGSVFGVIQPMGVAVSADGERIYVTETDGQQKTRLFDRDGNEVAQLVPPEETGSAHLPVYVAVDPTTQEAYVSDRLSRAVYVYSPDGQYLRTFTPAGGIADTWEPLGLGFSPDGHLFVSDVRTPQTLREFNPDGTVVRELGAPGDTSFANAFAVDQAGNVAVSDSNNGRVAFFAPDGSLLAQVNRGAADGELSMPRGLAIDGEQRLFVVDTINQQLSVYDMAEISAAGPRFLGIAGQEGIGDGQFEFPNGVAADNRGRVYVTDRVNNRVQIWSY